jgi:alkanesulfonate monooxygenase SsuD/methylene tetrahydromethanopterin reductase-like flavin-dependent oxidoreductase (luciferase family)
VLHQREYQAFGYPTDHRVGRFGEAIRRIGPLGRGEPGSLAGRWYQVHDAPLRPPPDIVQLAPKTTRSLDRLVAALQLRAR